MNLAPENMCGNRQAGPDSTDRKDHTQREFHGCHRDLGRIVKVRGCELEKTENCLGGEAPGHHWNTPGRQPEQCWRYPSERAILAQRSPRQRRR